jgi:hypothetical protein
LPGITYATATGIYTRAGNGAPDELAALPAGTGAYTFAWSADGRWLGWLSGAAATATTQVHITDTRSRVTRAWSCAGCRGGAFADGHLIVANGVTLTAYPQGGGAPATLRLSGPAFPGLPEVLASTPHDASALFFAGDDRGGALYQATLSGAVTVVSRLSLAAAPGGDRPLGDALVAISPDRKTLGYECNILGGDSGEPSDGVTIVNLATGEASTEALPDDPVHPLRISAVWVDSAGQVHAIAWPQPGDGKGAVPEVNVAPHEYRLGNGHWTDAGARNTVAAGGANGWTVTLEQPATISDYNPAAAPGRLVATLGSRQVTIAENVTSFSWNPAGGAADQGR